ncbi:MAG: sortase, partial [Actinomycetota bacterium]|nr:sortase [Actinomycetota bacterium]
SRAEARWAAAKLTHATARVSRPRLPAPQPLPANPWTSRPVQQLGRIVIRAIGLDQPFFEGVDQAAFAHGVGHWPGTAAPGGFGNAVFGGHRVTQTHPFLDNDKLRAGDAVDLVTLNGWTYVYRVTKVFVVPQSAMWIADQKPGRTLTLFTCHPKGSDTERLVTTGVLDHVVSPA